MKKLFPLLGVFAFLTPGVAFAANFQTFTDPNLFTTALLGGVADVTELFSSSPVVDISTSTGQVFNGAYWDVLVYGQTSTLSLGDTSIYGAGGFFDLTPNGFGTGLEISVGFSGGGTQSVAVLQGQQGFASGFFGFISDTPFVSIILSTTNLGGVKETFSLDNLSLGTSGLSGPVDPGDGGDTGSGDPGTGGDSGSGDPIPPVPEPSTFAMAAIALAGIAGLRRVRRS